MSGEGNTGADLSASTMQGGFLPQGNAFSGTTSFAGSGYNGSFLGTDPFRIR